MSWLDLIGWCGSALLVVSLLQARVLRFRVLNLLACVVLTGFNAALGIWPMVAMNVVLVAINLWHIRALAGTRHDDTPYDVLEVGANDEYLRHVLRIHGPDIARFQRDLVWDGVARVQLDYVTPPFRDFSPPASSSGGAAACCASAASRG